MTREQFKYVSDLIREAAALTLEPGKEYLVESRLTPLARQEGFDSYQRMIAQLQSVAVGDLHRKVVEAMTNNETSFFRDARLFGMLRNTILPALVARRASERTLNIWCAACSSGQEPYSIAMLLRDHFPGLANWKITLVASDISRSMLAHARTGRYTQLQINRGLPAALLVKYFVQDGTTWEISPVLRRMVDYREINLIESWPVLPRMDMIFIRNVLIYFDVPAKKNILARIHRALDPSGYVVLGGAETTLHVDDAFERASFDGAMCFQRKREDACA